MAKRSVIIVAVPLFFSLSGIVGEMAVVRGCTMCAATGAATAAGGMPVPSASVREMMQSDAEWILVFDMKNVRRRAIW